MPVWLYQAGPWGGTIFLVATVVLGGGAAYVAGRAIALTWRPAWQLPVYMAVLACAVRFIHYAVFSEPLLSPQNLVVDYAVVLIAAIAGYRLTRSSQMTLQYGWTRPETDAGASPRPDPDEHVKST